MSLLGAWVVGLAIARLTGAAAVVLLLVATFVSFIGIAIAGWWRLRSVDIVAVVAPGVATVDEPFAITIDHRDRSSSPATVWIEVAGVRKRLESASPTTLSIACARPAVVSSLRITTASAGAPTLVWWRRRHRVETRAIHVAPHAAGPPVPVVRVASPTLGEAMAGNGAKTGHVDGSRPWRQGEGEQAIHWPSTLRAGEVIAHDRTTESETRWQLDLDNEAGPLRHTIEEGLRLGHRVTLTQGSDHAGDGEAVEITSIDDARHWSAVAAERSNASGGPAESEQPFWRRQLSFGPRQELTKVVGRRSRIATAAAAAISLWMLLGALAAGPVLRGVVLAGVIVATSMSLRFTSGERPLWARSITAGAALAALGWIAVQNHGVGGLLEALRGPMPDLLMLLVVVHGAEIADRRSNRVHLAVTGIVTAYAAGLRIDGAVGWWMIAWALAAVIAVCATDRSATTSTAAPPRTAARVASWSIAGVAAALAVATLVPIPDGPASLGLPARSVDDNVIDQSGALVGPDGAPIAPSSGSPTRGAIGQVAGYPGFSTTLDTSVRGDLGDDIVMRVRAPEPAFWRGQTFTDFDGRRWTVSDDMWTRTVEGPRIDIFPTIGDATADGVPIEEFVQTFYVEADLPNVVFAATRAEALVFDGSVTNRSDGALRADRTLSDGTVYSVVSQRVDVSAEMLHAQGDLGTRFAPFADRAEVAPFLDVPTSTSDRTIELAERLRVDGSTYSTILAYQAWIGRNTRYDLDAPIPDGDAVDDFLFGSQLGFCEQIASSLVVMLRTQGVPARLATGYIPGERDRISGVFAVKASDAHAWVEVWFPETGWQAFDPTASVPLAGEGQRATVGGDAAKAALDAVFAQPVRAGALLAGGLAALAIFRAWTVIRRRRARGPWGLLHDRFMALAPDAVTAPQVARMLTAELGDDAETAHEVAQTLDRVAFDDDHLPTDADRACTARSITTLERGAAGV
jgi:transglutaminase-like putative cysteine protease